MKHKKKGKFKKFILFLSILLITGFAAGLFWTINMLRNLPLPDFETFEARKVVQSTKIYDRTGENLLYDIHQNIKRTTISYDDIPRHVKNATVAIEDSDFYNHKGFKLLSIMRAFIVDILSGKMKQGGSTITQQLVKNAFLTPEKSPIRKIKELILA